ncbi:MAG: hypothetical protein ABSA11_00210 [Candidatus Bathyarchaeia archaeon]
MAEQGSNSLVVIAAIVSMIPGAYFTWLVLRGLILSLRQGKDEDL